MAYARYLSVAFGTSKAGLLTVGYQLFDTAAVASGGRITAGVQDIGSGAYGALVTIPASFRGRITWDTGEATPAKASEPINPETLENADVKTSSLVSLPAVATVAATVAGTALTLRRGETLAIPLSGLGNLTGRTKLYFTLKGQDKDTDAQAVIQIEETAGLLRLNGAAATANQGSFTVTDVTGGAGTVGLVATAAASLPPGSAYLWDVEVVTGTTVRTPLAGTAQVVADVTRAVA